MQSHTRALVNLILLEGKDYNFYYTYPRALQLFVYMPSPSILFFFLFLIPGKVPGLSMKVV